MRSMPFQPWHGTSKSEVEVVKGFMVMLMSKARWVWKKEVEYGNNIYEKIESKRKVETN
jgi:hypothetical protein